MQLTSVSSAALQPSVDPNRSKLNSIANTFDAMSDVAALIAQMGQNLLAAKAQLPQMPGASGASGAPGAAGAGGLGAIGALLQSATQMLTMLAPLLQALSNSLGGANQSAHGIANQLPGNGMGVGPSLARPSAPLAQNPISAAAGGLGGAIGGAVGGPVGAAVGNAAGNLAGTVLNAATRPQGNPAAFFNPAANALVPPTAAGVTNAAAAAGGAVGAAVGNAVAGPQGAVLGQVIGQVIGQAAGGAATPTPASLAAVPGKVIGVDIGAGNQAAALAWAKANGGPTMTQADMTQGMNLYSIFNNGQRMF